jgi:uncharacterized delta-60 repeat protein
MFWSRSFSQACKPAPGPLRKAPHATASRVRRFEPLEGRSMLSAGGLDPTFGSAGFVTTPNGVNATVTSIAVEPDGKIVAAGIAKVGGNDDFAVARYNTDGSLDAAFGNHGMVTTAIGHDDAMAYGVAIQSNGSIIVVGHSFDGSHLDFTIARYHDDGSLDASFGQGGIVTTALGTDGAEGFAVAIQSDGKIVVAGEAASQFALARFLSDGSLDTSFGTGGVDVLTTVPGNLAGGAADGVAIEPDGKIVAVGGGVDFSLVRVNADGRLDKSFGSNGFVTVKVGNSGGSDAVAIQRDGRIVVGGSVVTQVAYTHPPVTPGPPGTIQAVSDIAVQDPAYVWFGLARYNSDGSLDTTFGNGGTVTTKVASGGDALNSLALESDGRIVAAGGAQITANGFAPPDAFAAAIYNSDGTLDTDFANGGIFVATSGTPSGGGFTGSLDANGNILLGGGGGSDIQHQGFVVARVTTDSSSGGDPSTALLDNLYESLLGRAPDPAGLAYWRGQIANGISPAAVARAVLSSAEYLGREIGLDYQQLLHRAADAQGLAFYLSAIQTGQIDLDQVALDILVSPEFAGAAGGSNANWVDALYTRLLDRAPDAADVNFWLNKLNSGAVDPQQAAQMFLFSDEYRAAEAVTWYEGILSRMPTPQEVSNIVAELSAGTTEQTVLSNLLPAPA